MGLLGDLLNALAKVLCGGSAPPDETQQQQQPPRPQQPQAPVQPQPSYADHARPPGQAHEEYPVQAPSPHHKPQHQQQQQQQQQQPYYPPSHPASPPPSSSRPTSPPIHRPGQHQDQNQINQHNEHYIALRARANAAGDQMARCFEQSHAAYAGGDGARAKQLSNEGKSHQREMEDLNRQASEWIFVENNKDSRPGEIDLHGLYVKEAISYSDTAIQNARQRGDSEVHLIVGKGLHSAGGVAKLKPAIEELIQKHSLVAALDPHNAGVLIVHLDGRGAGSGERAIGADDITRKLDRGDDGCIVM